MSSASPTDWRARRTIHRRGNVSVVLCENREGREATAVSSPIASTLDAVERAHGAIESAHVPRLRERTPEHVILEDPMHSDLEQLISSAAAVGLKAPYGVGVALNEMLMDALEAAHACPDGPFCLGEMAWANILLDAEGRPALYGFGVRGRAEQDRPGAASAPEVVLGADPTPASDVYLVHTIVRSLLPHVELLDSFVSVAVGGSRLPGLSDALFALDRDALNADPSERPQSIAELRGRYREIRSRVPEMPAADETEMRAFFRRVLEVHRTTVRVHTHERRLELDGCVVELGRHETLWRVIECLLASHERAPGACVSLDEIQAAGWPAEKILPRAARSRIYVAISQLRKLGLATLLERRADGYRLHADVLLQRN